MKSFDLEKSLNEFAGLAFANLGIRGVLVSNCYVHIPSKETIFEFIESRVTWNTQGHGIYPDRIFQVMNFTLICKVVAYTAVIILVWLRGWISDDEYGLHTSSLIVVFMSAVINWTALVGFYKSHSVEASGVMGYLVLLFMQLQRFYSLMYLSRLGKALLCIY